MISKHSFFNSKIENVYNELFPEQVFKGEFLDDEIPKFYEADTVWLSHQRIRIAGCNYFLFGALRVGFIYHYP